MFLEKRLKRKEQVVKISDFKKRGWGQEHGRKINLGKPQDDTEPGRTEISRVGTGTPLKWLEEWWGNSYVVTSVFPKT